MNCHIIRSKCPALADTRAYAVACGSLSQCCQWLSPVSQLKFILKLGNCYWLLHIAACEKTSPLPTNLIIQWTEVRGHSSLAMKLRQSDLLKLETV